MEILIVCSGNIVRSAFAQGLLRKILSDIGVRDAVVFSAGTLGIEDQPADPEAIRLASERGFDLRQHRSKGLRPRDVERADLIVVMERAHQRRIVEIDASAAARTRLLTEFDALSARSEPSDTTDPVDGPRDGFARCFEVIERCVVNLAFELKYRHGS